MVGSIRKIMTDHLEGGFWARAIVRPVEDIVLANRHHGQPAPLGIEAVAALGKLLFMCQKFFPAPRATRLLIPQADAGLDLPSSFTLLLVRWLFRSLKLRMTAGLSSTRLMTAQRTAALYPAPRLRPQRLSAP